MVGNSKGAALSLAAFSVYAIHDVVIKSLGGTYSAFQIIFFSGLLSFPLVAVMLLCDRTNGNLLPRRPFWMLLRSATAVLNGVLAFYAFAVLPLAQTYSIMFTMPLLTTLLAIPLVGEKVGIRRGSAIAIGFLGVIIVLQPGTAPLTLGHFAAIGAAFLAAFASVIVRKIASEERSAVLILYPLIGSCIVSGAVLPYVYQPMPLQDFALMGMISVAGFIGALLIIQAFREAPAAIVAPMQYSQILWAALYGAWLFNESMDQWTIIGSTIIILSGIYVVWREHRPSVS